MGMDQINLSPVVLNSKIDGGDLVSTGIKGIADACRGDYLLVNHGGTKLKRKRKLCTSSLVLLRS